MAAPTPAQVLEAAKVLAPLVESVAKYIAGEKVTLPANLPSRVKLEASRARAKAKSAAAKLKSLEDPK